MQVDRILHHLGVEKQTPSAVLLNALMASYVQRVPWETASRIVRRSDVADTAQCPRWPDEFWDTALARGTGGTCFESNYAFFSLLRELGFKGYLTINNMGDTVGCHTACIIEADGERWLVDAGLPLHVPVPLDADKTTEAVSPYLTYSAVPSGEQRFQIERAPHPHPNCFTLLDTPIDEDSYRAATIADYDVNGLFLDKIIVNKVVDGNLCRFNGTERPYHIQRFVDSDRTDTVFDDQSANNAAEQVAQFFTIDQTMLKQAFINLNL
jgi:hypothetical protein